MINYDKVEIREQLQLEHIFTLLQLWGGEPEHTSFGIISSTICHNKPGIGSRKLYFYQNSGLFICYTGCAESYFDVFELCRKVHKIQKSIEMDLNDAVRWVASYFGFSGEYVQEEKNENEEDYKIFSDYERIEKIENKEHGIITLKEYDKDILGRFNYDLIIEPWLKEGISQQAIDIMQIGYYCGGAQITIPHLDENGRLIGVRGRTMVKQDAELYGKYRPLKVNQILYNHPLGMNLYNYFYAKENIARFKKAIVLESEKSCLQYKSFFGPEADISVACCGSSISNYQMEMLLRLGVEEIIIAFDRQFQEIGDEEFQHLKRNLLKIHSRYSNYTNITFIFDKDMITQYKDAPTDRGKETFLTLFKQRIIL